MNYLVHFKNNYLNSNRISNYLLHTNQKVNSKNIYLFITITFVSKLIIYYTSKTTQQIQREYQTIYYIQHLLLSGLFITTTISKLKKNMIIYAAISNSKSE